MKMLIAKGFKVFVPAKDFQVSLDFYQKLGWKMNWLKENELAELENNGHQFFLQNYYNKHWANNFMIYIDVENAHETYEFAKTVIESFKTKINPPKDEGYAVVTHVWDPSGVLLHFAESTESS